MLWWQWFCALSLAVCAIVFAWWASGIFFPPHKAEQTAYVIEYDGYEEDLARENNPNLAAAQVTWTYWLGTNQDRQMLVRSREALRDNPTELTHVAYVESGDVAATPRAAPKPDLPLPNLLAVAGDKLVGYRYKAPPADPKTNKIDKTKITNHLNAWQISDKGIKHLWEDSNLPPDEGPHLAIANGVVYGVGKHLVRCLDIESGKVLGEITEAEFPHKEDQLGDVPRSNPLLLVAGDKLVLSPEGQHGKHGFILFDSDPKKLTLFGSKERKWAPPHATTTAYGRQPIVNPIVDGRMFFRGGNGIYCYDLRQR